MLGMATGAVAGLAFGHAGIGSELGGIAGAAASSPRLGAALIGASDNATGFIQKMIANPQALQQVASTPNSFEVRRLAQEISRTLVKDGPISAAGVTRLVADTPFFVGLVHSFDLAEQRQQKKTATGAIARIQSQQQSAPQIANPQTAPTQGPQ
jgi:hypothetical protein